MPPKSFVKKEETKSEFPIDTLNRSKCLKEAKIHSQIQSLLGTGSYGSVFTYCSDRERKNAKCKYVLKVQKFGARIDGYLHETFFHDYIQKQSKIPIVPKLFDYWTCLNPDAQTKKMFGMGFMIVDKWDGDLDHGPFDKHDTQQMMETFQLWIPELVRLHVAHQDIHSGNVLWRDTGKKQKGLRRLEFALTDWGLATVELNETKLRETYQTEFMNLIKDLG